MMEMVKLGLGAARRSGRAEDGNRSFRGLATAARGRLESMSIGDEISRIGRR
jgi:hypothetical protein